MQRLPLGHQLAAAIKVGRRAICLCAIIGALFLAWQALIPATPDGISNGPSSTAPSSSLVPSNLKAGAIQEDGGFVVADPTEGSLKRDKALATLETAAGEADATPLDPERLGELASALDSGPIDDQVEAIRLLGQVGTPEQKGKILEDARDPHADTAIRIAAVENIDWTQHLDVVGSLIRSDPDVGEAIIYIAAEKEMSPESAAALTETVSAVFSPSAEPSLQLAVLHFLAERNSDRFDSFAAQATSGRYSQAEIEDFNQLLASRTQEQEFLQGIQQSSDGSWRDAPGG